MNKKYIIHIAPVIPLPIQRSQVFSYWNNEDLPVGTLVSAPFYFREIQGIVTNSRRNELKPGSMKLKNINKVIEKKLLSENQIELAKKIADHYFSPLGAILKLMIPRAVKKRQKEAKIIGKPKGQGPIGKIAEKILKSKNSKVLLMGSARAREKIDADLIREFLKRNKQCLILVPEILFSQGVYEKLREIFFEEIALIHSRTTKGQLYEWWKKIKNNEIKIIISSKLGIYLPFCDLGLIIVRDEQDVSFKQSKAMPRYNAIRGAEFLADITGAKLALESSVPSVENFYRAKIGQLEMIRVDRKADTLPDFETTSLEQEKMNPDFPISKALYSRLANILRNKKQAVVYVNRRGFSTRTICENCKNTLRCPKCNIALVYSDENEQYHCLHCSYKKELLSACPSCGGFQFSHRGIGTQTVEKKIKKLFPSAELARLDADTTKSLAKNQKILQKFASGEINILIGTQSAIKGIYSENIGLVASISGRDITDGFEFNSRALVYSRLFNMSDLLDEKGSFVVQTFFGPNPLLDIFADKDFEKYYKQEMEMRKRFCYPPFFSFLKLSYRGKSRKFGHDEVKRKFDLLVATSNNEIEIVGPYEAISGQKKGEYTQNILLKIDSGKDFHSNSVRVVVGGLKKGWIADIDPVDLF